MWHINLEGIPSEIGNRYGEILKEKIEYYCYKTKKLLKAEERKKEVTFLANKLFENIQKAFPELSTEIETCAQKLHMSIRSIMMLVAFNDLWWGFDYSCLTSDCTNLGLRNNTTEPILGQTFDLPDPCKFLGHSIIPHNGYKILYVARTAPGQLSCGINEHGLCLGSVSSSCNVNNITGVPHNVLNRASLQYCSSIEEVVELRTKYRIASGGYTLHVMDNKGNSKVLEVSPERVVVVESGEPYLFNTVFISKEMQKYYRGTSKGYFEKRARLRLKTFQRLLCNESGIYSLETMKKILSDHSKNGPIWDWTTQIAIIMFPKKKSIMVFDGPPDYNEYEEYSLSKIKRGN